MSVAKNGPGGTGTLTSALAFGGNNPSAELSGTEEWNADGIITETID
jgi:hypothetical protein